MKITKRSIFYITLTGLLAVNLFVLLDIDYFYIRAIFNAVFLMAIPGLLIMLTLKIRKKDWWEFLVYIVGLSVTFLIFVGLATNGIFTALKVNEPLSPSHLLIGLNFFLIIFLFIAMARNKRLLLTVKLPNLGFLDWMFLLTPAVFPILAIFGAISLNNHDLNPFTITMLGGVGSWILAAWLFRDKLDKNIYPAAIFFISLALLLMTSLRGWYTTGHDNQLEYFVFQLTKFDYTWDIAKYRDPYNASLSITILPTVYYSFLKINDAYIYKVVFQIIFSFIAISLFKVFERFVSSFIALLSVFSFVSFPTFLNDMPMLNRQEIAMFFFSLILLDLFAKTPKLKINKLIFYIFGFSMVVSHYSTTYIAIALFVFVYVVFLILKKNPYGIVKTLKVDQTRSRLRLSMVLVLLAFTLFWNVQLTSTTAGLTRLISETYKNIGKTFSQDLKSGGVLYSLFSYRQLDKEELLKDYIKTSTEEIRERVDRDQLYNEEIYNQHPITLVKDHKNPPTIIGSWLMENKVSPFSLNFYMRQAIARMIQVFMILGSVVIWFSKSKYVRALNLEYMILIFASFVTLAIFVILPVLSIEYGAQRLFQQTLVISSLPLVIGLLAVLGSHISVLVLVTVFLSLSGFIPYVTGDYYPQLHLENSGVYFDSHLTRKFEVDSMLWLAGNYDSRYDIYSNPSSHSKLAAVTGIFSYKEILPATITKEAYVYLDSANTQKNENIVTYKGDFLIYKYPIEFLDQNKDLIYSNSQTKIYK